MPLAERTAWLITNHAPCQILSGYSNIRGDVIAVDAGLKTVCELQLKPKVIIGDFDSLEPHYLAAYSDVQVVRHQTHKNETDTELALDWCLREGGYQKIVICNDLQGRADHYLAIIQNLLSLHRKGLSACIESDRQRLFFLNPQTTISGKQGDLLSLISYSPEAHFKESRGLEYPLNGLVIKQHQSRGISNVFNAREVFLDLQTGDVLAIYSPLG